MGAQTIQHVLWNLTFTCVIVVTTAGRPRQIWTPPPTTTIPARPVADLRASASQWRRRPWQVITSHLLEPIMQRSYFRRLWRKRLCSHRSATYWICLLIFTGDQKVGSAVSLLPVPLFHHDICHITAGAHEPLGWDETSPSLSHVDQLTLMKCRSCRNREDHLRNTDSLFPLSSYLSS